MMSTGHTVFFENRLKMGQNNWQEQHAVIKEQTICRYASDRCDPGQTVTFDRGWWGRVVMWAPGQWTRTRVTDKCPPCHSHTQITVHHVTVTLQYTNNSILARVAADNTTFYPQPRLFLTLPLPPSFSCLTFLSLFPVVASCEYVNVVLTTNDGLF